MTGIKRNIRKRFHILLKKIEKNLKIFMHSAGYELIRNRNKELHIGGMLPKSDFREYLQFQGFSNVGIVIQGPIDRNNDFTINTIKQLRYIYPDIKLVLSTWNGEVDSKDEILLKSLDCNVLTNDSCPTENKGKGRKVGHLNNQLYSSIEGIKLLKQQGIEYVMKMRTDTRIYKNDFVPYFLNLLRAFPCKKSIQKYRLINVAFSNNLVSVPFFMSDFIWFGAIDDMERMYSIPTRDDKGLLMLQNLTDEQLRSNISKSWINAHRYTLGKTETKESWTKEELYIYYTYREEAYITHTYVSLNKLCDDSSHPMISYYEFLRDYALVVDETELMAYFDKYEYSENSAVYSPTWAQLTHSIWLDILLNFKAI